MKLTGLSAKQVEESRLKHGSNTLTEIPPDPLWKKVLEGFKDPMIMILLVALFVQVVLFFLGETEWFEPVAILIAILIANGVASVSESIILMKLSYGSWTSRCLSLRGMWITGLPMLNIFCWRSPRIWFSTLSTI